MIEIFDNILDTDLANRYDQEVSKLKWSYEYQPVTPPLINKHWYSDGKPFINDLLKDLVDAIQLKGMVGQFDSSYLLAHTHGLEQQAHYDACDFTMIYYPQMDWKIEWGGGTFVYKEDAETVDTIAEYRGNRLLVFDAHLPHQAQPVAKNCLELRMCVVFKLWTEAANRERLDFYKDKIS